MTKKRGRLKVHSGERQKKQTRMIPSKNRERERREEGRRGKKRQTRASDKVAGRRGAKTAARRREEDAPAVHRTEKSAQEREIPPIKFRGEENVKGWNQK